jgi:TonB family protein
VKVHGSRVTEVVRGVTPHTEPFEEQTSTMIIFPQGGVLRMSTAVSAGQMLVLTNSATKQDAICRVVKVRTFSNMQGYVEVEFTHPQPTYWGVTFPGSTKSEATAPAKSAPAKPPAVQPPAQQEAKAKPASDVSWAPAMPASAAKPPAAELPKAPAIPPVPQKPFGAPSQPASSFIAIGSQEKVELPATATTSRSAAPPEVREAKREAFLAPPAPVASAPASPASPAASSSTSSVPSPSEDSAFHSLSMTELLGDSEIANAGAPAVQSPEPEPNADAVSSAVPSSAFGSLSGGATLDASHSSPAPAASAASAPEAFGARFDSAAAEGSKGSPNLMLIAAAIGVLIVVVGGGAIYLRSQKPAGAPVPASSVPARATSIAPPAANGAPASATPQFTQPAAPSAPPASAEIVAPHGNSVAVAPGKPAATSASQPAATRPSNAAVATPAAPAPSRVTGNMVAESLNAHPVTAQRSTQDQDFQAPSVDAAPSADSASDGALPSILSSSSGPAAPEVKAEVPVKVGGNVREPRLTYSVQPVYPVIAKEAHVQGDVVVATTIDQKGNVVHTEVISGPPMLRGAALAALKRWRYEPSQLNGEPIAVQMMVTLKFRM